MKVEILVASYSLELTVLAHDNLGLAPLRYFLQRGPMQHGATDAGYRLDPRVFSLVAVLRGSGRSDLYAKRHALQTYLSPGGSTALLFTLDNGDKRQINCRAIDVPLPHDARQEYDAQVIALRFVAPEPTFYDPTGATAVFGLSGGGTGTPVPLLIPWTVGASTLDQEKSIQYAGNFMALPWRIRFAGPIASPKIENQSTNEKLDFTGYAIGAGHYYDIDCRYGYKAVVDDLGNNKISELSSDSDLATFHLGPHPEIDEGRNSLRVTGTSVNEDTEVYVYYYNRYLGI